MLPGHPEPLFKDATHLFCDFNKLKPDDCRVFITEATAQNMVCLKTEYIADYLVLVRHILFFHLSLSFVLFVYMCGGELDVSDGQRITCGIGSLLPCRFKLRLPDF